MLASQHQKPKSDIEISQTAEKRRILDIAKDKLGIAAGTLWLPLPITRRVTKGLAAGGMVGAIGIEPMTSPV